MKRLLVLGGAAVLIAVGVRVQVTRIDALDLALTLLWVVGMVNAFNFVDSMDGLALGLDGIASAFFILVRIETFVHIGKILFVQNGRILKFGYFQVGLALVQSHDISLCA